MLTLLSQFICVTKLCAACCSIKTVSDVQCFKFNVPNIVLSVSVYSGVELLILKNLF